MSEERPETSGDGKGAALHEVIAHPVFNELFEGIERATLREGELSSSCILLIEREGVQELLHLERKICDDDVVAPRFVKEWWTRRKVIHAVPVPLISQLGTFSIPACTSRSTLHYSFLLETCTPVASPVKVGREARLRLLIELGRVARRIGEIRVDGFGDKFDGHSFFYPTWERFLSSLVSNSGLRELCSMKVVSARVAELILDRVDGISSAVTTPYLYHGALAVEAPAVSSTSKGEIESITDWGLSGGGPRYALEMSRVLLSLGLGVRHSKVVRKEFSRFLTGFGVSSDEYCTTYQYLTEGLAILHALSALTDTFKEQGGVLNEADKEILSAVMDLLGTRSQLP